MFIQLAHRKLSELATSHLVWNHRPTWNQSANVNSFVALKNPIAFYSALLYVHSPHVSDVRKSFPNSVQSIALPPYSRELQAKIDDVRKPNWDIARQKLVWAQFPFATPLQGRHWLLPQNLLHHLVSAGKSLSLKFCLAEENTLIPPEQQATY